MRIVRCLVAVLLVAGTSLAADDEWTLLASAQVASGRALWDGPIGRPVQAHVAEDPEIEALAAGFRLVAGVPLGRAVEALFGGRVDAEVHALQRRASRLEESAPPPKPYVLVRAHTERAEDTRRLFRSGVAFLRENASVDESTYREVDYVRVRDDLLVAVIDELLVIASHDDLLARAIDAQLDGAHVAPAPAEGVTVSVDPSLVPRDGAAHPSRIDDNPLADLLFAGLFDVAARARLAGARVTWTDDRVRVAVHLDGDTPLGGSPYAPATEEAQPVPTSPATLAVFTARRDVADWWRRRESLLSPSIQKQLAKFDSDMTTLFAGQDFAEDVLARLDDAWALVVDRQDFALAEHVPDVELPGVCLVARIRPGHEAALTATMRVAFQSVIAFVNADRAERGRAPFLLDVARVDGVRVHSATLQPALGRTGTSDGALEFNATPSLALVDDWLLLGSSAEQVARLVSAIVADDLASVASNTAFDLDVTRVLDVARADRAALVAQTVLDEGLTPRAAGEQVDTLFELVGLLERVRADVAPTVDGFALEVLVDAKGS